uniref:Cell division protein ZapB n=2 Tax=Arsenophonus nasoniae TaxID=638 RepID=D2U3D4_9GAMM|nr:conserved hypothetical protein [Arsenophonus nasoniae]
MEIIKVRSAFIESFQLDRRKKATYNRSIAKKGDERMSFEVFEKLEAKVQQALETIELLQMEVNELKEKNNNLYQEVASAKEQHGTLAHENENLKQEQHAWQERLRGLLGRMEDVQ